MRVQYKKSKQQQYPENNDKTKKNTLVNIHCDDNFITGQRMVRKSKKVPTSVSCCLTTIWGPTRSIRSVNVLQSRNTIQFQITNELGLVMIKATASKTAIIAFTISMEWTTTRVTVIMRIRINASSHSRSSSTIKTRRNWELEEAKLLRRRRVRSRNRTRVSLKPSTEINIAAKYSSRWSHLLHNDAYYTLSL